MVIVTAVSLLVACDNRPVLKSDGYPFSVGGIALGMTKSDLEKKHELLSCNPETQDKAKCYVDDRKFKYDFFGAPVGFLEIKLLAPYTTVTELHFAIKGVKVKKSDVERAWGIEGRCLGKTDIEEALKFDSETSGYFARSLDEFHLLPNGNEDFVCLMPDYSFIKYNQYPDKSQAGVDVYYLKDVFVTNYGYLFRSRERYATAKKQINQLAGPARTDTNANVEPFSEQDKALIVRIEKLNGQCRGGSGDDPKTQQACDQREAAMMQAKNSGWCWGPDSAIGSEKHWIRCE
jgi:hypothetical protein